MASLVKMPAKASKPKLSYHSSVIQPSENGGLSIEHTFMPKEGYGPSETKLHTFGPGEHQAALDNLHAMICTDANCGKEESMAKKSDEKKEADKNLLKNAKSKLDSKLKSFKKPPPLTNKS